MHRKLRNLVIGYWCYWLLVRYELLLLVMSASEDQTPTPATPLQSNTKKRYLSSPYDDTEYKKVCASSNVDMADTEAVTSMSTESSATPETAVRSLSFNSDDLAVIAETLKESFKLELVSMVDAISQKQTQTIVDGVIEGLHAKISQLENANLQLAHENRELRSRVLQLEQNADAAEQYSRRNCLRLSGLPEQSNENTDSAVLKICETLKVPMDVRDIDRSHRIGKPSTAKPRQVIIKFATYRARQRIFKARSGLKDTDDYEGVFINEDLTKKRNAILYAARRLVKHGKLRGCWSSDGTILVKDKSDRVTRINSSEDLMRFENDENGENSESNENSI